MTVTISATLEIIGYTIKEVPVVFSTYLAAARANFPRLANVKKYEAISDELSDELMEEGGEGNDSA